MKSERAAPEATRGGTGSHVSVARLLVAGDEWRAGGGQLAAGQVLASLFGEREDSKYFKYYSPRGKIKDSMYVCTHITRENKLS